MELLLLKIANFSFNLRLFQFFNVKFLVPNDVKDPKKSFPEVAHYYMDDSTRETKQLKISQEIDQKFKTAEKEIIRLLLKVTIQKKLMKKKR